MKKTIASPGCGILTIDESNATCGKRLTSIGLDNTEVNKQAYRQLLLTTPGLGEYISGAIMFEETLYQSTTYGKKMVDCLIEQSIVPGIKVDDSLVPLPGALFAKWRTVVSIPCGPSALAVKEAYETLIFIKLGAQLYYEPDVGKIYLLIKAKNKEAANERMKNEIINTELFKCLQQKHGKSYQAFMLSKLVPVVGNACDSNLGLDDDIETVIMHDVNIIVNSAANTTFDERCDVSLDINTGGPSRVTTFAKKCKKLKLFLQISTDENCQLKAIDFGLSDYVKPNERLNDIVGSAYYVAPEVLHKSFWARTESGIFRAVLKADPSFDESPWPSLYSDAVDFVNHPRMEVRWQGKQQMAPPTAAWLLAFWQMLVTVAPPAWAQLQVHRSQEPSATLNSAPWTRRLKF
ncbi:hypothetical protein POM88_023509 [Heracleum sosnowskyi]|uniref:fructose-bisphosphate aldolase n=1 Tax=Heracleum sosnowskyi TaxID=360622 RepID=A0AAD8MUN6_9APIA|nr:hypothetical protein POM88_023509 [Heracleum sosnowskyi]